MYSMETKLVHMKQHMKTYEALVSGGVSCETASGTNKYGRNFISFKNNSTPRRVKYENQALITDVATV